MGNSPRTEKAIRKLLDEADCPRTTCSPSSTPATDAEDRGCGWVISSLARKMERALRASIAYDEARFRRIRYACFGEVPEGMKTHPKEGIEAVLEADEETTGEEFRKLRDAALGIPENANVELPPNGGSESKKGVVGG